MNKVWIIYHHECGIDGAALQVFYKKPTKKELAGRPFVVRGYIDWKIDVNALCKELMENKKPDTRDRLYNLGGHVM